MKLSTRGRSAVIAMIDLVQQSHRGPVVLSGIGRRQGISLSYLEMLFISLRSHGLVSGVRGRGGGYRLARPAAEISVANIVAAVDAPLVAIGCGGKGECMGPGTGLCMAHELWAGLNDQLIERLSSVTLEDLIDDPVVEPAPVVQTSIHRAISLEPVLQPIKVTGPNTVFGLGDAYGDRRP